jgi:hypothetical protein
MPYTDRDGYELIQLSMGPRIRVRGVHRLVCIAFKGEPPFPKAQVRHRDNDPSNNREDNLSWGTHRDNMDDRIRHNREREHAKQNT